LIADEGSGRGSAVQPSAPASDVIDWQPAMLTSCRRWRADDRSVVCDGELRGQSVKSKLAVRLLYAVGRRCISVWVSFALLCFKLFCS